LLAVPVKLLLYPWSIAWVGPGEWLTTMYTPGNNQSGISDFKLFFVFAENHLPARSGVTRSKR
jgi:hypothetical protein